MVLIFYIFADGPTITRPGTDPEDDVAFIFYDDAWDARQHHTRLWDTLSLRIISWPGTK